MGLSLSLYNILPLVACTVKGVGCRTARQGNTAAHNINRSLGYSPRERNLKLLLANAKVIQLPLFSTGVGPPMLSGVFETALPDHPGSPSHVTAMWMSGDAGSVLVCWEPSEVGEPFISYTIYVLEVKSNVTMVWNLAADLVKSDLPNCTAGYQVSVSLVMGADVT